MKFITDSMSRCGRIGSLTELEKFPDTRFETPLLLLHTRGGSVPHLTKDVFKTVTNEKQMLSVTLPSTITMLDAVKRSNSFAEFVSMKEYPTLLTIQDPSEKAQHGHQAKTTTGVWNRHGHCALTPDKYMDIVEAFKPEIYLALCDGNTDELSKEKRISKATERSRLQFERCYARHKESSVLKNTWMLGAVEGGYDVRAREKSAMYLMDKNVEGYVIDGLHMNGPEVQYITFDKIKTVMEHTLNLLPPEKLKISMGCWSPLVILELINSGVDVFDSSYPFVMTEESKAITFMCSDHDHDKNESKLTISIDDKCYADDFSPICDKCTCLTCKNHSRAYLNHLHHTKELLRSVLLMIHNIHAYMNFFKTIREQLKNGTFEEYKTNFLRQFS